MHRTINLWFSLSETGHTHPCKIKYYTSKLQSKLCHMTPSGKGACFQCSYQWIWKWNYATLAEAETELWWACRRIPENGHSSMSELNTEGKCGTLSHQISVCSPLSLFPSRQTVRSLLWILWLSLQSKECCIKPRGLAIWGIKKRKKKVLTLKNLAVSLPSLLCLN